MRRIPPARTARRAIRDGRKLSRPCKILSFFAALCIAFVMLGVGQVAGPRLWDWITRPEPVVTDFQPTRARRALGYVELFGWIEKRADCVFPGRLPSVNFYIGDVSKKNAPWHQLEHGFNDRPEHGNINRPAGMTAFGPWWIYRPDAVPGPDLMMWTFHMCGKPGDRSPVTTKWRIGDAHEIFKDGEGPIPASAFE